MLWVSYLSMRNKYSKGLTVYTPCHLQLEKSKFALSFANGLRSVLSVRVSFHYWREDMSCDLELLNRKNSSPSLNGTFIELEGNLKTTCIIA